MMKKKEKCSLEKLTLQKPDDQNLTLSLNPIFVLLQLRYSEITYKNNL